MKDATTQRATRAQGEATFWEEMRKARDRIGEGKHRVRWLLEFADEGLSALSTGRRLDRRYEVLAFTGSGPLLGSSEPPDDLLAFQEQVKQTLDGIRDRCVRFKPNIQPDTLEYQMMPDPDNERAAWKVEPKMDRESRRGLRVLEALSPSASLIRRCPRCDTRFLAARVTQAFCSHRCQTQAATHAYRTKKRIRRREALRKR